MGHVVRFTLIFREIFWKALLPQPALCELSFLFTEAITPSVWWTSNPEPGNTLTGWVGGPRAAALQDKSAETLGREACHNLAGVFQLDPAYLEPLLIECFTHDWSADANACGAYSYIAKDGLAAPSRLATPIEETLYFAGEHTDTTGHWGTVHAALGSGLRAARQILAAHALGSPDAQLIDLLRQYTSIEGRSDLDVVIEVNVDVSPFPVRSLIANVTAFSLSA